MNADEGIPNASATSRIHGKLSISETSKYLPPPLAKLTRTHAENAKSKY